MKNISVLIKPASGACNMTCDYCFYCDEAAKREQRENEEYEPRQLDYDTGLPMKEAVRKKC